ncbi:hypothetical protein HHK36_002324 [Tetracentron sinense]|uniref:GPI-anchored protein LLG1-like domain-containing protein n=1 Tax=Tetracentron sinense TaxID=13715 RepID=A0A834ZZN7_TETSI|nr:hypothetical protein HHK36_002324 [Tetracentron sinense]
MAPNRCFSPLVFFLLTGLGLAASASSFISGCPVNLEFLNYTIITGQCRGPQYPPKLCCAAFKEFACPYADQLNDLTNDCASTMFSYINLYGQYPPGLFASECREGKEGLACPATPPTESVNANGNQRVRTLSPRLAFTTGLLVILFQML